MADSLRDQLLKSGIVKQVQQERVQQQRPRPDNRPPSREGKPAQKKSGAGKPTNAQRSPASNQGGRDQSEIDLAKAYAIRAQTEASERKRVEQEAAEQARLRRERKLKVQQTLEGKALNKADADLPRNFQYGDKIRRIYVDAEQLRELNAGELGVVQQAGRYLLVSRAVAEEVKAIDPHPVALLIDTQTDGIPEDGVPDDLMW
ncbi:DUF2058 family protein [Rhodanobacter sp. L36]|uniref:DUF2058 domain-containing protein n=1 Tax=Rhodanobacter sp. L36 TaxID=1747221 RepID=UPI00131D10F0|nr:DUF2058 family protein [Rhodanobacter sp. L36]